MNNGLSTDFVSIDDAARAVGVHRNTILRRIRMGELDHVAVPSPTGFGRDRYMVRLSEAMAVGARRNTNGNPLHPVNATEPEAGAIEAADAPEAAGSFLDRLPLELRRAEAELATANEVLAEAKRRFWEKERVCRALHAAMRELELGQDDEELEPPR